MTLDRVCVIGAGSSGLLACKALKARGIRFDCFEKGSQLGGGWRYMNDNGLSPVYASLRTNTSRKAMRVAGFPMPAKVGHFPHHSEMLAYLESFADHFGLCEHIRFGAEVTRVGPAGDGGWRITLDDSTSAVYDALLVANGHNWEPRWPDVPGTFVGEVMHSRDYRTPDRFAGKRVLVVGFGSSAAEIVSEVATVAEQALLSYRRTTHVVPRWLGPVPFDHLETRLGTRTPWPLQRFIAGVAIRLAQGSLARYGLPKPAHKLFHYPVAMCCDLLPALRRGDVKTKPDIERLMDARVRFIDGSLEELDAIIYATGYKISLPFFLPELLATEHGEVPLYQRIAHPEIPNIYFVGLVDPFTALFPIVEGQSEWIADVLAGKLELPSREEMWAAIEREADRLRKRFSDSRRYTLLRARYPYLRSLARERRSARSD